MLTLPEGVQLSAEKMNAIRQKLEQVRREPRFIYPWPNLEERVEHMDRSCLPFVGYGSLLNRASAHRTLSPDSLRTSRPVIALGARRIFNYEMSIDGGAYGPPTGTLDLAALNVRVTAKIEDVFNGVLVEIPLRDIPDLCKREKGYDLEPLACLDWEEPERTPFLAYVLQAPDEPRAGKKRTNNSLRPHQQYYRICRNGAKEFGDSFLSYWLATTYLADGITTVRDWEAAEFPEPVR